MSDRALRDELFGLSTELGYGKLLRPFIETCQYDSHKLRQLHDLLGLAALGKLSELGESIDTEEVSGDGA